MRLIRRQLRQLRLDGPEPARCVRAQRCVHFRQLESASGRLTAYGRAIYFLQFVARVRGPACDGLLGAIPLMSNCADPTRLSLDERSREVATILAAGITRLRQSSALSSENAEKHLVESSPDGLEVPAETRLSVRVG